MKRIIDGVTYNTDTSTKIATAEVVEEEWRGNPEEHKSLTLYQTRGGAFFIHAHIKSVVYNRRTEEAEDRVRDVFEPMTREEAQKWIMEGEVELLNDVFGEPPEAVAEASPGMTLYARIPGSLKERAEALAQHEGLSLNAWTMRCVERCANLRNVGEALGEIIATGEAWDSAPEAGAYSATTPGDMVEHMREQAEKAARLLGWHGKELEGLSSDIAGYPDHRVWPVYEDEGK